MSRIGTYSATPMQREQRDPDEEVENQAPEGSSQVGGGYMFDSPHTAAGYNQGAKSSLPFNAFQGEINPNVMNFMETHGGALQGSLADYQARQKASVEEEAPGRTALGEIDEREARFNEMLAELEGKSYGLMNNRMADSNARAGVIAGRMGSSVGGGYGGAMAQQQLDNLRALDQHQLDWGSMSLDAHQKYGDQTVSELQRLDQQANSDKWRGEELKISQGRMDLDVLERAIAEGIPADRAMQAWRDGTLAELLTEHQANMDTANSLRAQILADHNISDEELSDHQKDLLRKAAEGDEGALAEFNASITVSGDAKKSQQDFLEYMQNNHGIKSNWQKSGDKEFLYIMDLFDRATTPEQLAAAQAHAEAWKAVKAAHSRIAKARKQGKSPSSKDMAAVRQYNETYGRNLT
jgi:hypothetical protein